MADLESSRDFTPLLGTAGPLSSPSPDRSSAAWILLVIRDESLRGLARQTLERSGYRTAECSSATAAQEWLCEQRPDLLLADDSLEDLNWDVLGDAACPVPCVLLVSRGNEPQAIQAVVHGVRDYVVKGLELMPRLPGVVRQALLRVADERNLAEAQRRLRLSRFAIDHAAEAIFTVSPEGLVLDVNASASKWLGYSVEELRGTPLADLAVGSHPVDWPSLWETLRCEGRAAVETGFASRSGQLRPVELLLAYLRFEGDEYCCVSARDITERKAVEQRQASNQASLEKAVEARTRELERTHERLRQSERLAAIGTLASGFAHEINNPLGAIRLSVENALEALDRPEDAPLVQKLLRDAVSYTERCKQIVVSLMRLAWPESPRLEKGAVNDVVRRAVAIASRYALACGARVEMSLAEGLPPVDLSEGEIVQAVRSLLENACESRTRGAVVLVRTEALAGQVVVSVEDNGRGMTPAEQQRIFEPFFTTKKEQGGVGLGLTVAHAMIAASRGRLEFESVLGKGSKFQIRFEPSEGELDPARDGASGSPAAQVRSPV